MDSIKTLIGHWIDTTSLSVLEIITIILKTPNEKFLTQDEYVVISDTPLACPMTIFQKSKITSDSVLYTVCWVLLNYCGHHIESLYAFILTVNPDAVHSTRIQLLHKLQKSVKNICYQDTATTQALCAGRQDLQTVVLMGYKVLYTMFRETDSIREFLESAFEHPWKLVSTSPFYGVVKDCIVRASISTYCEEQSNKRTRQPWAILEGAANIYMLGKDKYLLLYLLLFATSYSQYLSIPLTEQQMLTDCLPIPIGNCFTRIYQSQRATTKPISLL